jgi:hypothetical protein
VGSSYGLGDSVFPEQDRNAPPPILQVGIRNPLGEGIRRDLLQECAPLMQEWRGFARDVSARREMGLDEYAKGFRDDLRALIDHHPIVRCDLTIFALGTVLLWLEFAPGVGIQHIPHLLRCFEFAAYRVQVSRALRAAALMRLSEVGTTANNPLIALSKRPAPSVDTDTLGRGESYSESRLLTSFSTVILCVDHGDDADLPELLSALGMESEARKLGPGDDYRIEFEYHGTLYFSWASCVIVPRKPNDRAEPPEEQIARIVQCIRIAHAFLGTCEAFESLVQREIHGQVERYLQRATSLRDDPDLNRLRTLTLAAVSLTSFVPVAAAEEDQRYFALFERYARMDQRRQAIVERCGILYSVQSAESAVQQETHDRLLARILAFLAGLTLLSVAVDSYNFYKGSDPSDPLSPPVVRALALAVLGLVVLLLPLLPRVFQYWHQRRR